MNVFSWFVIIYCESSLKIRHYHLDVTQRDKVFALGALEGGGGVEEHRFCGSTRVLQLSGQPWLRLPWEKLFMWMRPSTVLWGWEIQKPGDVFSSGLVKSRWEWLLLEHKSPGTRICAMPVPWKLRKSMYETLWFRNVLPTSLQKERFLQSSSGFSEVTLIIYLFFKLVYSRLIWSESLGLRLLWTRLLLSPMRLSLTLGCPYT